MQKFKFYSMAVLAAILMLADAAFGQDTTAFKLDSAFYRVVKAGDTISPYLSAGTIQSGFTLRDLKPSKILFYGKEINNKILEIRPNGDIYFTPSSFCDCKKCKSFKGMKFLMNFLNN